MPRGPRAAVFGLFALLASTVIAFVLPASAHGAPYPPKTCARLAVSTTTPRPGETITVSGRNFHAGDRERLVLRPDGATLATVTVRSDGTFSTPVTIPGNARGHQAIHAVGPAQTCAVAPIRLSLQSGGAPVGGSPSSGANNGGGAGGSGGGGLIPGNTGTDLAILLIVAAALIATGVALTRGGRDRRARRVWTP